MKNGYLSVNVTVVSQYVLIFFSVKSKYSVDEPIIYKLSELKKNPSNEKQTCIVENRGNKILQCIITSMLSCSGAK
jgi:hypothetical protein